MGQSSSSSKNKNSKDERFKGAGSGKIFFRCTKDLPPLIGAEYVNWRQGDNTLTREPFVRIVYLNHILPFVIEEIFEAVRYSWVCRDWREAIQFYCNDAWFCICRNISSIGANGYGYQSVFGKVLKTARLTWTVENCFRQRVDKEEIEDEKSIRRVFDEETNSIKYIYKEIDVEVKDEETGEVIRIEKRRPTAAEMMKTHANRKCILDVEGLLIANMRPLWIAVKAKCVKTVALLLEYGANPAALPLENYDLLWRKFPIELCLIYTIHKYKNAGGGSSTFTPSIEQNLKYLSDCQTPSDEDRASFQILKMLVDHGALSKSRRNGTSNTDINTRDRISSSSSSPCFNKPSLDLLRYLCYEGSRSEEIAEYLLSNQDFLDYLDFFGAKNSACAKSILMMAADCGWLRVCEWIFTRILRRKRKNNTTSNDETIISFGKNCVPPIQPRETQIENLIQYGKDAMNYINEVDLSKQKNNALRLAMYYSSSPISVRVAVMNLFLDYFIDGEDFFKGHLQQVSPGPLGSNVIHLMLMDYHSEYLSVLKRIFSHKFGKKYRFVNQRQIVPVSGGTNNSNRGVHHTSKLGKTYLYIACFNERVPSSFVEFLLSECAEVVDVHAMDSDCVTALEAAKKNASPEKYNKMMEAAKSMDRISACWYESSRAKVEAIEDFIRSGKDKKVEENYHNA